MATPSQTQSLTPLTPPTSIKYQIGWQQTPTTTTQQHHPEQQPYNNNKGSIVISVTDITTITSQESGSQRQYMAVAKLTWGSWEANFGCTYYPLPRMFLKFNGLRMNEAMRDEVQGMHVDGDDSDEEREEGWENAEVKIRTAAVDDHGNWMLRVEVGGGVGNESLSDSEQRLGVKLWAKRVVGNEEVLLSVAEKHRLQID